MHDRVLFIRKDQILADVDAQIEIALEMRQTESASVNMKMANVMSKYSLQFDKWVDKYLNLAKSRMGAYVVNFKRRGVMNAKREWEEAVIHLHFPPTWNDTLFENLADAVHQYIVNSVVAEYFILAFTSRDALTSDKLELADEASREIKHCCVSQKPGCAKKTLHPF